MVEYEPAKHKELSEQLATWWHRQTEFKTKKALADFLKVHPDTLGDYFSGRRFPRSDIADTLCELTNIECLKPGVESGSSSEEIPQESSGGPLPSDPPDVAASIEEPQESDITGPLDPLKEAGHLGERSGVISTRLPRELPQEGGRHVERSVVISLQRTSCPFCGHDVAAFRGCVYCGQHFVWANVPLEYGQPM